MKRYLTPLPWNWFLRRPGYVHFMAREATSFFILGYLVFLVFWLRKLGQGPEAYESMMATAKSPVSVVLHVLVLLAAVYHSITWFNLTPKIMPIQIGEEKVPEPIAAVLMGYGPWLTVTAALLWVVMR